MVSGYVLILRQIDGPMVRQIDLPRLDLLNSQYDLFWLNRYVGNRPLLRDPVGEKISNVAKSLKPGGMPVTAYRLVEYLLDGIKIATSLRLKNC